MTKKVLVVDDEPGICDIVCLNLEIEGYQADCAESGEEALEKMKSEPPDLVILDIMMPEVDGWELLSHMKADPSISDIPVILLSAKSEEISKLLGFQLGAEDYVTKPFSVKELLARIGIVLGRHGEQEAQAASPNHDADEKIGGYKNNELYFLNPEDIYYVAADRNNSFLHTNDDSFILHRNLSFAQQQLPDYFQRVHKSYIINLHKVSKLTSPSRGAYTVELTDTGRTRIPVGRGKVQLLRKPLR